MSSKNIEKAIFDVMYDATDSPISTIIVRSSLIEDVSDQLEDVDQSEIEYQLTVLEEDWFLERDNDTVAWRGKGMERYEDLGGETNLDPEVQNDVLEILLEEKKNDPNHAYVSKEELIDRVGKEEKIVTENVWKLRQSGYVELRQAIGSDYISVTITSSGRRMAGNDSPTPSVQVDELRSEIEEEIEEKLSEDTSDEDGENETELESSEKASDVDEEVDDVFICHASEDKEEFVDQLAHELRDMGLDVWYDEFRLEIGDSIPQSIDRGLANSRYGIVVLSEHFFEKDWPQKELDALAEKEVGGEKVILPVWLEIDRDYVSEYSPRLASRYAGMATKENMKEVAEQLEAVISN